MKINPDFSYETEEEIKNNCAYIAMRFQDRIDNQASYLYDKILNWRKKYGNYPTHSKIKVMLNQLKTDLIRRETKYREYSNGKKIGNGKYIKEMLYIDNTLKEDEDGNAYNANSLEDPSITPDLRCEYDYEDLLKNIDEREKFIIKLNYDGYHKTEIGKKLNISSERVNQILVGTLNKIKETIGHEL